ncbi:MAG: hypothetical protein IJP62_03290 [Treponema sp.]|nr:hypothetical protein [Treponema sp.]
MKNITTDDDFDEFAAKNYFAHSYEDINLLPNIPRKFTESLAAILLNVSEPTIKRMVQDGQITLEKQAVLTYIKRNMLVNRPLNLQENTTEIAPKSPV